MKYRKLGRTGLDISVIGLGTMTWGLQNTQDEGFEQMDYALEQGWTVKTVLNNDGVGGSCGSDGFCDDAQVRVFSEGVRAHADERARPALRRRGRANASPSRNLSRWLATLATENRRIEVQHVGTSRREWE